MSINSPVHEISHPIFKQAKIQVYLKRDDLIHPIISGNKWRKLKFNLRHVKQIQKYGVISFGGAYSNHLHALAYACKENGLACKAIVRGESHYQSNATLSQAKAWGMELHFVDRKTYRLRNQADYLKSLNEQFPQYHVIPEGGTNKLALKGVSEVITELNQQIDFDTLITPVGSAGTISGLIAADQNRHNILGINVLKGAQYLEKEINTLLGQAQSNTNWQLLHDYHLGGYAKFSADDAEKIANFNKQTRVTFEPIYSGKMLLAFLDLIENGYFSAGEKIVLLHTGGLQGINGLLEQKRLSTDQWPWQLAQ